MRGAVGRKPCDADFPETEEGDADEPTRQPDGGKAERGRKADGQVGQINGRTAVPNHDFVAQGAIAVFGAEKEACKDRAEKPERRCKSEVIGIQGIGIPGVCVYSGLPASAEHGDDRAQKHRREGGPEDPVLEKTGKVCRQYVTHGDPPLRG